MSKLSVLMPQGSTNAEDAVYLLVDLKAIADPTELPPLLAAVQAACDGRYLRTLAYGPHVHETWLAAASHAGFDTVMTQGQFDRSFDQWLSETNLRHRE